MKGKQIGPALIAGVIIAGVVLFTTVFIIILSDAERHIPIQYSKKIQGRKMAGNQATNIPLKVNTAGVIPIIFASSILQFPLIIQQLLNYQNNGIVGKILVSLSSSSWFDIDHPVRSLGLVVYIFLVIVFAYFYTSITFNPIEVANNMKKQGGMIPGIRPGKPTQEYLSRLLNFIIFIGAAGLVIVAVIPFFFNGVFSANVSFGGTSLIIVVGVILETKKQIESQVLVRKYTGFLNN
jgi:preprotein translocase subunit SecY